MPVITIDIGKLSKEQKEKMVQNISQVASDISNIPLQAFVVLIKELEADNVGVGGVLLSNKH
ncbi:hypothetical protein JCM14036_00180 [Desulfotomaculum defluvii]